MKIALYMRVSTHEQTTDTQLNDLKKYVDVNNHEIVDVYKDEGISGSKSSRPGLNSLMEDAQKKRFDMVLVWKFDRMGRSVPHLLQTLTKLNELGIEFCSFTENIDTSKPMGRLIFVFLSGIAEFERSLIQERVKAGLARVKAEGKVLGRPRKGWDFQRAVELRRHGKTYEQIADVIGIGSSTIHRHLSKMGIQPQNELIPKVD